MKNWSVTVAAFLIVASGPAFAQAKEQKKPLTPAQKAEQKKEALMTQQHAGCPSGEYYDTRQRKCEPNKPKRK